MDWITCIQNTINYIGDHISEELYYGQFPKAVCRRLPASGYELRQPII